MKGKGKWSAHDEAPWGQGAQWGQGAKGQWAPTGQGQWAENTEEQATEAGAARFNRRLLARECVAKKILRPYAATDGRVLYGDGADEELLSKSFRAHPASLLGPEHGGEKCCQAV